MNKLEKIFYKSQRDWVNDDSPLKILVKSRQTGFSWCNCYRLVRLVSAQGARLDAYISSLNLQQARLQLDDCRNWAGVMKIGFTEIGELLFDKDTNSSAYVLQFANGRRIYSLSSNPNALAGKRGHVTLDEFALHEDQRLLYRVAKPVTTWGGQLSIISTHRGSGTLFNQIIRSIKDSRDSDLALSPSDGERGGTEAGGGSPLPFLPRRSQTEAGGMGEGSGVRSSSSHSPLAPLTSHFSFGSRWSLHEVPIQKAVEEGIVERINKKTGRNESRHDFLARHRAECVDEEQWLQEYCCTPADETAAFFSYEMLDACTDPNLKLLTLEQLVSSLSPSDGERAGERGSFSRSQLSTPNPQLFLGVDVARKRNLCVIDVGEKFENVMHDRLRIELHDKSFTEIESHLYPLLRLPQLKRACIDETGMGVQLAEQARERFGWKVEPITFTPARKEELAFALRRDFEDCRLRIPRDDQLRADLRALKKEITPSGKLRFIGDTEESHCDRTWAKALRQHAARHRVSAGAIVL